MRNVRFIRVWTATASGGLNALVSVGIDGEEFVLTAHDAAGFGQQLIDAANDALEHQKPALEKQGWVLNPGSS
jgi:hypothetical protein